MNMGHEEVEIEQKAGNLFVVKMTVTKGKLLAIMNGLEKRIEAGSHVAQDMAELLFEADKESGLKLFP